jgi:hypothetical protein
MAEQDAVEAGERHRVRVGNLHDGQVRCRGPALAPVDGVLAPFDDEPTEEGGQDRGLTQVVEPVLTRAFLHDLAEVLEDNEETRAAPATGEEAHPIPRRIPRELGQPTAISYIDEARRASDRPDRARRPRPYAG